MVILPPAIRVVGISGKAGTGKDYLFEKVLRPRGYVMLPFAAHLKIDLVGLGILTYEEAFITKPPHARTKMQIRGTEEGWQKYGQMLWVDTALAWIRFFHEHNAFTRFVIPDVRFPHELDGLKSIGQKVVRIQAPQRAAASTLTDEQRQHLSETALDDTPLTAFSGVIRNDPADDDWSAIPGFALSRQWDRLELDWDQLALV